MHHSYFSHTLPDMKIISNPFLGVISYIRWCKSRFNCLYARGQKCTSGIHPHIPRSDLSTCMLMRYGSIWGYMRWVPKFAKDKTINKICWRGYGSCTCFDWSLSHSTEFYWWGQYHQNQKVTIKLPKDVTCIVLCLFIADAVFVFVAVDVLKASLEEFKDNESGGATAM